MGESRRVTRRGVLTVVGLAVVVLVAVGVVLLRSSGADGRTFVTRKGEELRLGDSAFRFVGFNLYDAAASDIYSCSPSTRLDDGGLDEAMQSVRDAGGTVVRFWAYQTYTAGGTDFSGVDRLIGAARSHGLRVLPVLEDGPGNCSTGESGVPLSAASDGKWYSEGYRRPLGDAAISYRDYARRLASHYQDEPTIMGWSLMNEAETTERRADGASALVDFARDVADVVHEADPHHLVTLGTQSNGAPGASGADFADVYGLPGLDFAEAHDWGAYGSDEESMPGASSDALPSVDECRATDAKIACAFVLATDLGKPLVIGEVGISADDDAARERRAELIGAKARAAFGAGAAGYLVWQLNVANTDGYGVIVGSDDPLFGVLRATAERWSAGS